MLKRIFKKIFLLGLPVLLALGLGLLFQQESDFFEITESPIQIEFEASHENILTKIKPNLQKKIERLKGKNIWEVSLSSFREDLESLPWVQKVSLSRRLPDKIETEIQLDEVIFLFADRKNNFFPVLRSGKTLGSHDLQWLPSAPVLRNNNIFRDELRLVKIIEMFEQVPSIGPLKRSNIAEVDYSDVTGLSIKLIEENVLVHFGSEKLQTKALQVLRVVDYLKSQKLKARVIDASFSKKVLVRPRKRS